MIQNPSDENQQSLHRPQSSISSALMLPVRPGVQAHYSINCAKATAIKIQSRVFKRSIRGKEVNHQAPFTALSGPPWLATASAFHATSRRGRGILTAFRCKYVTSGTSFALNVERASRRLPQVFSSIFYPSLAPGVWPVGEFVNQPR